MQTAAPAQRLEEIFETPDNMEEGQEDAVRLKQNLQQKYDRNTPEIAREAFTPGASFEVFAGKVYETSLNPEMYSLPDKLERKAETPLQRFTRLRQEVADLTNDLESFTQPAVDGTQDDKLSVWRTLQTEASRLNHQLLELKTVKSYTPLLEQQSTEPQSIEFQALLSKLASVDTASQSASSDVTYELFYDPSAPRCGPTNDALVSIEARVRALEALIGASTSSTDGELTEATRGALPLVDALSKLDRKASLLDEKRLEILREKVGVLKSELEVWSRERSTKTTTGADARVLEQSRRVDEVYEKLQHVETVSAQLPTIVARMRTLQGLHRDCSTFSQRLEQLETMFDTMSSQVSSNISVLQELHKSLSENAQRFDDNVKVIDERIRSLR